MSEKSPVTHLEKLNIRKEGKKVIINDIQILRTIGKGAFGKVKLGQHAKNKEFFALKKLSKMRLKKLDRSQKFASGTLSPSSAPLSGKSASSTLDRLKREIEIMGGLKHPCIASLIAVWDDPEKDPLYIVTECCHKGQIMKWNPEDLRYTSRYGQVAAGGLPEEIAHSIFKDLVSGLEYLQSQGIAHRDLKPENILVDAFDRAKIIDFGEAEKFALDATSHIVEDTKGTTHFMSPEACIGDPYDSFVADVWALGVVLFAMVYGTLPWISPQNLDSELYDMIATSPLSLPNTLASSQVRDLITHILDKDQKTRYTLEQIKSHEWYVKELVTGTSTTSPSTASPSTASPSTTSPSITSPSPSPASSSSSSSSSPFASLFAFFRRKSRLSIAKSPALPPSQPKTETEKTPKSPEKTPKSPGKTPEKTPKSAVVSPTKQIETCIDSLRVSDDEESSDDDDE